MVSFWMLSTSDSDRYRSLNPVKIERQNTFKTGGLDHTPGTGRHPFVAETAKIHFLDCRLVSQTCHTEIHAVEKTTL